MEWLKQQGPWCPSLIEHLRRHQQQYDVLVFFTYLYAPTVLGLEVNPGRSVLVSTAHDEPAIKLEIFKDVFRKPAAFCYLTDSERRFVEVQFPERPLLEETVGVGVDIPQQQPYPRMPPAADEDEDAATDGDAIAPTTRPRRRGAGARAAVTPVDPRLRLPPPPSPLRADGAVRRPHRSRQGLRRAHRVLQQLRERGWRRDARAHGRQADGAARGAVHPFRRPAVRSRAHAGARSGDRRHLSVSLREPVAARARNPGGRHAGAGERPERRARGALCQEQRRAVLRRSRRVRGVPEAAGERRAAARGDGTKRPRLRASNYRWDVVLAKYERIFAKIKNAR